METSNLFELIVGQIWQVTILCVTAKWLTTTVLKSRPTWSYLAWLVVMLKCVTPPVWASHCGVFSWFFQRISGATTAIVREMLGSSVTTDDVATCILVVWGTGAIVSLGLTARRWSLLQRRILASKIEAEPELQDCVTQLACHLGIRARIRLVLSTEPVGPAVVGVWRPMLVMPGELLRGKSATELEPMLAHELVHVKRGDTWVAMLETAVRSIWWFHPQVHRAADALSQTGELCCDQDVLTELTYPARRYADSLIQVIEARCRLQPLLGQPGIRQEQVTRNRLERIMTWDRAMPRQRFRLLVLLLALMVVLPGRSA